MRPINYLEGLPGAGPDQQGADLDPAHIAPLEVMARTEEQLLQIAARLALVRLGAELRGALGVVASTEATEVMLTCAEIAQADPDLAQEAGDSAEEWAQVSGAALAYGDVAEAIVPLLSQARANESVLLSALSGDVAAVTAAVARRVADEALPLSDRDVLRYRFARIDEEERKAEDKKRTSAARGVGRAARGEDEIGRIEDEIDAVLKGITVKKQLGLGQLPGLTD